MFPYKDENPTYITPIATLGLIAANTAMWLLAEGAGTEPGLSRAVCELGLIPGEFLGRLPPGYRVQLGPDVACVLTGAWNWVSPVSSMFLHWSWFHLIGNMWFLWVFGNNVEDSMGHARYVVFYVLCGLAAAAAQTLLHPSSAIPMVGASGAISGVMGAYIVLYPKVRVHLLVFLGFYITTLRVPAYVMLGYWLLLQLLGGLPDLAGEAGGGVAFWAHVGGFAAGALLISLFKSSEMVARHRAGRTVPGY